MPVVSIDTFFACSLMVMVVVAAMAVTAKIFQPYLNGIEDLNQKDYLREIANYILLNPGEPQNWGSDKSLLPESFGLAKNGSIIPYELDIDKVCRLNPENTYHISYISIIEALKVKKVAVRISIQQILDISITPISTQSNENLTSYTFQIRVKRDGLPVSASLHCYVIAKNFFDDVFAETSPDGEATLTFAIPNSSNGTAILVTFARSSLDSRVTGYAVYSFGHLSENPAPKNSFVELSPLNYTLYVNKLFENETLLEAYALTYNYNETITSTSSATYTIPKFLDKSPILIVVTGTNSSTFFAEWTAYPQIPLEMGANLQNSESTSFKYMVTINKALYSVMIQCGG